MNLSAKAIAKGNVSSFPPEAPTTNFRHPMPLSLMDLGLDHFQWFPSNASDRRLDPSLLERKQWQSNPAVILRSVAALLSQNKLPAVVKLSRNHTDCGSWSYYQMIAREIEDWPDRW